MRIHHSIAGLAILGLSAIPGIAETFSASVGEIEVTQTVSGLDTPWAIAFLPSGGQLITEREGRLLLVSGAAARSVSGVPDVWASGQGGLLDVVVARDFAQSGEIFLSYAEPVRGGAATAVAVASLDTETASLSNLRVIFRQGEASRSSRHFGSRIVEAPDGTLYVTLGERGDRQQAQSLESYKGKLVRINRDGTIPKGNPFSDGTAPAIWSYGHRNPQGAALDGAGALWLVEHGARGGDEINRPEPGKNYGWPEISYGEEYSGGRIGRGTSAPGMEQPLHYWDPSIAPSGMMIYSGRLWPEWRGDIFVGSLKFDFISRLDVAGGSVSEAERLFEGDYIRIRDIREAPDGSIWFLAESDGAAYRITPAGN
ncbi:PQQ-dependent sugar dehydrogenase [Amaricoccus macauensis]|uniref:PQQ-dependent sugar dehydrogenase n=1 Tax=Amaricoccus macauensis TaxID=57001 RepID=UPI003C79E6FF